MTEKKLRRIVEEFRAGILTGTNGSPRNMCFAVCSALAGYLHFEDIDCHCTEGKVGRHQHYWLTLPSGQIIDPTASQFKAPGKVDMPEVYIGEKPAWYKDEPWRGDKCH